MFRTVKLKEVLNHFLKIPILLLVKFISIFSKKNQKKALTANVMDRCTVLSFDC